MGSMSKYGGGKEVLIIVFTAFIEAHATLDQFKCCRSTVHDPLIAGQPVVSTGTLTARTLEIFPDPVELQGPRGSAALELVG